MKQFIFFSILFGYTILIRGQSKVQQTKGFINDLKQITDIMVFDVTSPVAAARYYAYATLSSYELMSTQDRKLYPSYVGITKLTLKDHELAYKNLKNKDKSYRYAMVYTARKLLPSGKKLLPLMNDLETFLEDDEIEYIQQLSDAIIQYANEDGFSQLNNLKRYTPKRGREFWQPTKPAFMSPVEPNWNTIKTFFLEKPDQFLTKPPVKFDLDKQSEFYKLTLEVMDIGNQNHKEKLAIPIT